MVATSNPLGALKMAAEIADEAQREQVLVSSLYALVRTDPDRALEILDEVGAGADMRNTIEGAAEEARAFRELLAREKTGN